MFKVTVSRTEEFPELDFKLKDFNALHSFMAEILSTEESEKFVFVISTVMEENNAVD